MTQTFWYGMWLGILLTIGAAISYNYGAPLATWLALAVAGLCAILASPLAIYHRSMD